MSRKQVFARNILLAIVWLLASVIGVSRLISYSNTSGQPANSSPVWPEITTLSRSFDSATLVVFVHPQCACSEATIAELDRLVSGFKSKVKIVAVFYKPTSRDELWVKSKLWSQAKAISQVQLVIDENGSEAMKFGVSTSGQALLYDQNGNLVFAGGITSERGHRGDSEGRFAILKFVNQQEIEIASSSVFGCSLKTLTKTLNE